MVSTSNHHLLTKKTAASFSGLHPLFAPMRVIQGSSQFSTQLSNGDGTQALLKTLKMVVFTIT